MSYQKQPLYWSQAPAEIYDTIANLQQQVEQLTGELKSAYELLQGEMDELKKVKEALEESQARLQAVIAAAPIILWTLDKHGLFTLLESKSLETSRFHSARIVGQSVFDLYSNHPEVLEHLSFVFAGYERTWIAEWGNLLCESRATPQRDSWGNVIGIIGVSMDISHRQQSEAALQKAYEELELRVEERSAALKESNDQLVIEIVKHVQAERALRYRVEFEQLIATLSTHFINLTPEEIDSGINRALTAIATFSGVDRSYVFLLDEQGQQLNNTHEWCAAGIEPQIHERQGIAVEAIYWWQEQIRDRETIYIPSVAQLPQTERVTKTILRSHSIKSLIVVPMTYRGSLIGFLGFDSVQVEKTWSEDIIALLRIVGEMFVNALERKRVEAALKASEKKYRNLVETSQDLIWSVDVEGRFTFVNQAAKRIYGYEPADMIGRPLTDFLPPQQQPQSRAIFEQLLAEVSATQPTSPYAPYETVHLRRDGTPVHLNVSSMVHKSENGTTILGITGTATDITERKRSEAALQQAKDQLQAVLDAVPGFISWVGADLRYIGVNQQLAASFQQSPDSFVGQKIGFLERTSGFEEFISGFFASSAQQASQELEIQIHGCVRDYLIVAQKYHQGQATVSVGIDISDRKRAEAQKTQLIASLQESERKFRSLYEATSDAVLLLDEEGIFDCNRAALEMFGFDKKEQLIGKHPQELSPLFQPQGEDSLSLSNERIATALQTGNCRFDWLHRRLDGSEFPAEVLLTAMEINSQKVLQGVVRDITERKRDEEETKAALAEKEVLLKEIHHRVKNNLQVISSLLRLQSRYIQDQRIVEMLKESQNRVRSMALVHEQLYHSKDLSKINFSDYIQDLAANLFQAYEVNKNGVSLEIEVAPVFLNIDTAVHCGLIINELVSNSLKYAFPEKCKGIIKIEISREEPHFLLKLSDNGIGFPQDLDFRNSGSLGLRLVCSLVNQLRGTIHLDNSEGTVFFITFLPHNIPQENEQNVKG